MNKISLTDEELGFLYSVATRAMQAAREEPSYRRRRRPRTAAQRAALTLSRQVHAKIRRAMPRGSARAADMVLSIADRF